MANSTTTMQFLILSLAGFPLLGALLVLPARRFGTGGPTAVAALSLLGSAASAVCLVPAALTSPVTLGMSWTAPLGPDLHLRADALGIVLAFLVAGIGACIAVYCGTYLHDDPGLGRLLATLLTFASAMQLIAVADDAWLLFVAWEMTSVCSYLLVMHTRSAEALKAATTALLVTGLGGLGLLAGLSLTQMATGRVRLSELGAAREVLLASPLFAPALVCIVLGAATKSALFPFHFWLPGAMAAPSPVSAYLHAANGADAALALVVLLIAHAGYKGTLFLEVGSIDHGTGTRSMSRLGGLGRKMPWTALAAGLGAASMMGLPPFAGFVAKEQIKLAGSGAGWLAQSGGRAREKQDCRTGIREQGILPPHPFQGPPMRPGLRGPRASRCANPPDRGEPGQERRREQAAA